MMILRGRVPCGLFADHPYSQGPASLDWGPPAEPLINFRSSNLHPPNYPTAIMYRNILSQNLGHNAHDGNNRRTRRAAGAALILLGVVLAAATTGRPSDDTDSTHLVARDFEVKCPMQQSSYPIAKPSDPQCMLEVTVCEPLNLALVHVFKSGGSSLRTQLEQFCKASTGSEAIMYPGWAAPGRGRGRPCDLDGICNKLTCYTMLRDPVERFFSGYHEAMFRGYDHTLRHLRLPSNATFEQKMHSFRIALMKRERNNTRDSHLKTQSDFLPATAPFHAFMRPDGGEKIDKLLCESHDCYWAGKQNAPACPKVLAGGGWGARNRSSSNFAQQQYVIREEHLTNREIARIAKIYAKDYCRFGFKEHPRAQRFMGRSLCGGGMTDADSQSL